ncbi:MAG: hypothetical protein PSV40_14510 [Polaromonas sp.]|uniref:hypothetical protein n=1 Tax=Polaromonas sp. TaxID=1869339 RepID=UPI00248A2FE7|nr:hypothetical protein [Polaromonas sp.]MDI1270294.1 hypothetical protein [Polaromonas sp.]
MPASLLITTNRQPDRSEKISCFVTLCFTHGSPPSIDRKKPAAVMHAIGLAKIRRFHDLSAKTAPESNHCCGSCIAPDKKTSRVIGARKNAPPPAYRLMRRRPVQNLDGPPTQA